MRNKYTKEMLEPLVKQVTTLANLARLLNLQVTGGTVTYLSKVIKRLNIDTSHFLGRAHNKGKIFDKIPLSEYLSNSRPISSNSLKNRLLSEGYLEAKCYRCNLVEWLNMPIPLELHHIDCDHNNNSIDNLTILCPNCHTLAHKKTKIKSKTRKSFPRINKRTVNRPPLEILLKEVDEIGYCATGRKYGVSDNAIRKWIKIYKKHGK